MNFLTYLKRVYADKFGWKLSVERVPQGMRVSVSIECWHLFTLAQSLTSQLWEQLKEAAKVVSYGMEVDMLSRRRWWWIVADPINAIRVLASFVGVTCSDAEARLIWFRL